MSSTIFAVCGSSSLTQVPACPCCENVNADFATGSVRLPHRLRDALPLANGVGNLRALKLRETWLVVERLELRRPAGLVQEDDALGLRREVGQRAQPTCLRIARVLEAGERPAPAASNCGDSSDPSAAAPMPRAVKPNSCRRVKWSSMSRSSHRCFQIQVRIQLRQLQLRGVSSTFRALLPGHCLIKIQNHARRPSSTPRARSDSGACRAATRPRPGASSRPAGFS